MNEITISILRNPWCSFEDSKKLLGLDFKDDRLMVLTRAWCNRFCGVDPFRKNELHRHYVEQFLLNNSLTSWRNAAIQIGMSENDLRKTVDCITARDLYNEIEISQSSQLVRNNEVRRITKYFSALRHKDFSKHSEKCVELHAAIQEEFKIEITPIYCATSLSLEEKRPEIAMRFDSIDGSPVGERHHLWLDTKKPINLFPDICSLKTFAYSSYPLELLNGEQPNEEILNILRKTKGD